MLLISGFNYSNLETRELKNTACRFPSNPEWYKCSGVCRHSDISSRHYPAINKRHQHSSKKLKADWGPCHRRNKWGKSLSQPMFLSPLMWLHDCAGTFMDCLIQCWRIKTKSRQTGLKPICDESRHIGRTLEGWEKQQKHKHFINNKTLPYFISSPDSIHSLQHFFFFSGVPSSCPWKWGLYWWAGPNIDFPSFLVWTFSGLLYYSRSIFP